MATTSPKTDAMRAMREARYEARQKAVKPATDKPTKAEAARKALDSVSHKRAATNRPKSATNKERSLRWREDNPDRYRNTQRELMRKRHAAVTPEKEHEMAMKPKPAPKPTSKPSKPGKPSGKKGC